MTPRFDHASPLHALDDMERVKHPVGRQHRTDVVRDRFQRETAGWFLAGKADQPSARSRARQRSWLPHHLAGRHPAPPFETTDDT